MGNRPWPNSSTVILSKHVDTLSSIGYRRIFYGLKVKDGASIETYLTGTIAWES